MIPVLVALAAAVIGALGIVHLAYTFFTDKFDPREPALAEAMKATSPLITRRTTMWKAWIGFNASHSLGAIFFAAIYLMLALGNPVLLAGSPGLLALGLATCLAYLALARKYWFRTPFIGILVATICFAAAMLSHFA